ncbi:hypothetical protein IMZ11_02300 [Microtetraspora sp. AC03309]|uniref:hypothetical protein n=1 Tax=Microtetraspora sp. AC03309 TaxID=2779376 RepID=UPI001E381439|nr:hypothetical protein [Microtetraspora sp. AC03309]MCC5574472.1 hypothetical protein [Microtetraspora sp. AC03309]
MAVAQTYRLPRDIILGRELRSVTTYEYDDDGRLVRSVTVHENPWDAQNVGWAVAKMAEDADRCPGCRMSLSETTAMRDGEPAHSYHVDIPRVCRACEALAKRQDSYAKEYEDPYPGAKVWEVEQSD